MRRALVAVTLLWAAPALAGSENAAARAAQAFQGGWAVPKFARGQVQTGSVAGAPVAMFGGLSLPSFLGGQTISTLGPTVAAELSVAAAKNPTKEIGLSGLRNRQQKSSLSFALGGTTVWVSGVFDCVVKGTGKDRTCEEQRAYVSILEDGKDARFYNVEDVMSKPVQFAIGSAQFKLSLQGDMSDPLESELILQDLGTKVKTRVTLRDLIAGVKATGEAVAMGGRTYSLFYYDGVAANAADPSKQFFTFILEENGFQIFVIPASFVPADKIAVFKFYQDKQVGLQQTGGRLRIFDNP
jgi:hypothetical protein